MTCVENVVKKALRCKKNRRRWHVGQSSVLRCGMWGVRHSILDVRCSLLVLSSLFFVLCSLFFVLCSLFFVLCSSFFAHQLSAQCSPPTAPFVHLSDFP